jgi:hypothetical protein
MANLIPISTVVVGSGGAASIEFTSIPQTYTDLVVKISARTNHSGVADFTKIRFNGVTTSYSSRAVYGVSGSANSATFTEILAACDGNTATSSTFGNTDCYIPNYAGSANKSVSVDSVGESNGTTDVYAFLNAGLFSNTAAITSIELSAFNGTGFVQYSTATLYGIRKY